MSAKEMFEELGYEYEVIDEYQIKISKKYINLNEDGDVYTFNYIEIIDFFLDNEFVDKGIHLEKNRKVDWGKNYKQVNFHISYELLKAINQQCKELGWLDE